MFHLKRSWRYALRLSASAVIVIALICILLYSKHKIHNSRLPFEKIHGSYEMYKRVVSFHSKTQKVNMSQIPTEFQSVLSTYKCPACYGKDMCAHFTNGEIQIVETSERLTLKGIKFAKFKNLDIVIKSLVSRNDKDIFDNKICMNEAKCDVSKMLLKQLGAPHKNFNRTQLQKLHSFVKYKKGVLMIACCLSKELFLRIAQHYDINNDRVYSFEESAALYTSLLINPEAALAPFFTSNMHLAKYFPEYLGSCGRSILVEKLQDPLSSSLSRSWTERKFIALQLLKLMKAFQVADPELYVILGDISIENFAVTEGRVAVIDLEHVAVIPKSLLSKDKTKGSCSTTICNQECFDKLEANFMDFNIWKNSCVGLTITSNFMYAMTCGILLSDLPEHKIYFESKKQRNKNEKGLLHGPPADVRHVLEKLLVECVEESAVNGRQQAVDGIIELLAA